MSEHPEPPFPEQHQSEPESERAMDPQPDYGLETYRGLGRLEGKAAIVTGGDSGIGRAVALAFAREGADVLIAYLQADDDAQETVRVVEAAGRRGLAVKGDLGSEAHCRGVVAQAVDAFGRPGGLVNNAAWQSVHERFADIPPEAVERAFRSNILPLFHLCRAALPHLPRGGAIVNTASIQAYQPSPGLLHYSSTKGAIVTFTKGL